MAATTMHGDPVVLSDEQFSKLVELLTPGYECSKLMLAELAQRDAERQRHEAERQAQEQGVPAQSGDIGSAPASDDPNASPPVEQTAETDAAHEEA
jgi:hypothetical protein